MKFILKLCKFNYIVDRIILSRFFMVSSIKKNMEKSKIIFLALGLDIGRK